MSEQRQISSYMEKEKNMDKRPSSATFSMVSLTPEVNNIPVSGFINRKLVDDDELMQCNDLLDKEEHTCFNIHENMSLESRSLLSGSWSCSTDSILSEVITSFDLIDVNEVIKVVCQSFFDPENMETEDVDSEVKEEVQSTENISTSRLTIGSDKSLSSSTTKTVIAEAAKALVSSVIDKAVKQLDATEAAKTPKDIGSLKTLQSTDGKKMLEKADSLKALEDADTPQRQQGKRCFSGKQIKVHPAPFSYLDEAVKSPSTDWTIFCTGESKHGSSGSQEGVEKTKAKKSNRFFDFFRNIFSKKNTKKKKVTVEENHFKWPSFWMHVVLV